MRARRAPEETRLFWKVLLSPCVGPRTRCRPAPRPQLGVGAGWVTNSHFPAPTPWGCPSGMLPSPVPAPSTAGHWLRLEEWPSVGSKILGPTGAGAGHGLSLPPGGTRRDSTPGERPLASRLLQGDRARCDREGGQCCPLQAQGNVLAPPASPWLQWMAGTLTGPTLWVPWLGRSRAQHSGSHQMSEFHLKSLRSPCGLSCLAVGGRGVLGFKPASPGCACYGFWSTELETCPVPHAQVRGVQC